MPRTGWAGLTFPNALNTGPTIPAGSLLTLTPGTAYHAAGGSGGTLVSGGAQAANTGWSVTSAIPPVWTITANAVLSGLIIPASMVMSDEAGTAGASG